MTNRSPYPAVTSRMVKLAAIREPGYPVGQTAPCFFHCPCGVKVPAFDGEQTCSGCGQRYNASGWLVQA